MRSSWEGSESLLPPRAHNRAWIPAVIPTSTPAAMRPSRLPRGGRGLKVAAVREEDTKGKMSAQRFIRRNYNNNGSRWPNRKEKKPTPPPSPKKEPTPVMDLDGPDVIDEALVDPWQVDDDGICLVNFKVPERSDPLPEGIKMPSIEGISDRSTNPWSLDFPHSHQTEADGIGLPIPVSYPSPSRRPGTDYKAWIPAAMVTDAAVIVANFKVPERSDPLPEGIKMPSNLRRNVYWLVKRNPKGLSQIKFAEEYNKEFGHSINALRDCCCSLTRLIRLLDGDLLQLVKDKKPSEVAIFPPGGADLQEQPGPEAQIGLEDQSGPQEDQVGPNCQSTAAVKTSPIGMDLRQVLHNCILATMDLFKRGPIDYRYYLGLSRPN